MKSPIRLEKWKKTETTFKDREWSRDETAAFEDAVVTYKAELRAVRDEVGTRSMPEVVRFFGHWKNIKLGEANRHIVPEVSAKPISLRYSSVEEANDGQQVGLSDDEGSIISPPPSKSPTCGACRTSESKVWWKAPKGLPTDILCDGCGTSWRKYADLNVRPIREESLPVIKPRVTEKREGTPLSGPSSKRARTSVSVPPTPPPPPASNVPQIRCLACMKNGPIGKVLKCKICQFRIHAGSCGAVVDPALLESWTCELCSNEESLEASINPDCLLCPRAPADKKKEPPYPPPDSFLRACKPTEGQGWAHVLCSVFTPETTFTDSSRLRLVEGLTAISRHRWLTRCSLCGDVEGSVIRCSDCNKEYHVSCAWRHGHRFGFEIQPVKSSRRDTTITTTFKSEAGCMSAIVSCKDHDRTKRDIYDICETNEGGETALQVYCRAYKQAAVGQAHGLLRKARRLDQVLNIRTDAVVNPPERSPLDRECHYCRCQFSPAFYPIPRYSGSHFLDDHHRYSPSPETELIGWECHKCYYEKAISKHRNEENAGGINGN